MKLYQTAYDQTGSPRAANGLGMAHLDNKKFDMARQYF
jgi:hypothetical protein